MNRVAEGRRLAFAGYLLLLLNAPTLAAQVADGQATFEEKCVACHTTGSDRLVGPGLEGVTERRDRDWIISFITNPDGMIAAGDSIATELLAEYVVPMPNFGITADEAEAILAYLATVGSETAPDAAANAAADVTPAPEGDADAGQALFTGAIRLENGGGACISCHSVGGLDGAGGGTLAVDLSKVATRYGDALPGILGSLPFPVMQDIFADRPLTEGEKSDLAAFFTRTDRQAAAGVSFLAFPLTGLGGALLVLLLFGILGRKRLTGVRKTLIGDNR